MIYLRLYLRGFVMVALVAANTRQIAHGQYSKAFVVAWCISFLWWLNSSSKREEVCGAGPVYALGAACGTMVGMYLGG